MSVKYALARQIFDKVYRLNSPRIDGDIRLKERVFQTDDRERFPPHVTSH